MPITALAPSCPAWVNIWLNASSLARSQSDVYKEIFPPNRLCKPAPIFPTIDRDRTMMPRTTPRDFTTRYPVSSKQVVVRGCVWLMSADIEHDVEVRQKQNL